MSDQEPDSIGDEEFIRLTNSSLETDALYEMVSQLARSSERMCEGGGEPFYQAYGGYPTYIQEYNRLTILVVNRFPEASDVFGTIELGSQINPASTPGMMWKTYAELATSRLIALAAFLKTKQGTRTDEIDSLTDLISTNLRPSLHADPTRERVVQDVLDTIFRARNYNYRREQDAVPHSSKRYIPDFTFDTLSLSVEVKLCNRAEREKEMVDEIGADIGGYRARYKNMLFVVYDLGFIRDTQLFARDLESNDGVRVLVVKK